jgi:hypothetical protein
MTRTAALLAAVLSAGHAAAAGVIPEPTSYAKPVPGGRFVFVMLGDAAVEQDPAKVKDPADRAKFRELREKHPRTGLYREGTGELVWAVEAEGYAPIDSVFPASDGVHLVRVDGEWWKTKDFPGGRVRPPAEEQQRQLDSPGVSFFAHGKLLKAHTVRELVDDPARLDFSPDHVLWMAGAVLNEDTGRFLLFTQDSNRVTFDYRTGEVVGRQKVGMSNPLARGVLIACAILTAGVLAGWAWYAFGRRKRTTNLNPVVG